MLTIWCLVLTPLLGMVLEQYQYAYLGIGLVAAVAIRERRSVLDDLNRWFNLILRPKVS
jgi:hypothetical protein